MPKKKSKKGRGGGQSRRVKRVVTIVSTDEIVEKETVGQPARKPPKKKNDNVVVAARSSSNVPLATKSTRLTNIYASRRRSAPSTATTRRRFTYKPATFVYQSKASTVSSSVRPKEHLKATARMLLDDERKILKAKQSESSKPPPKPVVRDIGIMCKFAQTKHICEHSPYIIHKLSVMVDFAADHTKACRIKR